MRDSRCLRLRTGSHTMHCATYITFGMRKRGLALDSPKFRVDLFDLIGQDIGCAEKRNPKHSLYELGVTADLLTASQYLAIVSLLSAIVVSLELVLSSYEPIVSVFL
jgi:hypothetical protein